MVVRAALNASELVLSSVHKTFVCLDFAVSSLYFRADLDFEDFVDPGNLPFHVLLQMKIRMKRILDGS